MKMKGLRAVCLVFMILLTLTTVFSLFTDLLPFKIPSVFTFIWGSITLLVYATTSDFKKDKRNFLIGASIF